MRIVHIVFASYSIFIAVTLAARRRNARSCAGAGRMDFQDCARTRFGCRETPQATRPPGAIPRFIAAIRQDNSGAHSRNRPSQSSRVNLTIEPGLNAIVPPGKLANICKEPMVSSKPILVLATVAALGSFVLSASAFAPPPPAIGGPPPGGPPPGAPPPGGLPGGGLLGGGLPRAGLPGGGRLHAGPPRGGNLGGRAAAGNVAGSLRGGSGGARFSGRNTFNSSSYSSARSGSYSGSGYGRSGRYGYYGAAAAGAAAGYAYGRSYGGETYAYNGQSCYRTVRYQTRSGWRKRVVYVCE